jgi:hypothetical protein
MFTIELRSMQPLESSAKIKINKREKRAATRYFILKIQIERAGTRAEFPFEDCSFNFTEKLRGKRKNRSTFFTSIFAF